MNDRTTPAMHALPDGEAELSLVVRLPWEDIARLGQEAGRLASQLRRPVTLDEAVGHRLRSARPAAHAKPAGEQPPAVTSAASVSSLPARAPAEQARQAIDRINGTA
ncbi:hypothetical protein [Streptomyces capillispiralis]|uniref:Uncharacterized protein n=1 Tax=Streptomyces capillispiralis TaxID=68182 RepID=A0A561TBE2_9ACTN|nr:hypothetical protein [Streptomyces capillispiralis]TWF84441.1 hypothetical protein FHX78_111375 [Streptomyces capillispiralis]GHH91985.1 hypothetical protein GCM10017779_24420 [Streptomyces capillispiralis]